MIDIPEPGDLSTLELADLRALRARLEEVENGLSYARRLVQGRLDTLAIELERRRNSPEDEVRIVSRLPRALAERTRSEGVGRPPVTLEPPAWADEIVSEVDEFLTPSQKADLPSIDDSDLSEVIERIAGVERQLSAERRALHTRIDRIQEELIGRYRGGASVDDLLH